MEVFEVVIALLLTGAALAAIARRIGAPYPALAGNWGPQRNGVGPLDEEW
jgi:hypothetical protein